jgi:CDGSH-type Zn-finger protein
MGRSIPKPRCGFCDGHHIPVDFDAAFPSFPGLLTRAEAGNKRTGPPGTDA